MEFFHERELTLNSFPSPMNPPPPSFTPAAQPLPLSAPLPANPFQGSNDYHICNFQSLPPGFKFIPHDHELILDYLKNKVPGFPLPWNNFVEVDLYSYNPEELAVIHRAKFHNNCLYLFTPRDRKYKEGRRPNRAAGDGYWKMTGAGKKVKYEERVVGYRHALVFYVGKPPSGGKTGWIMHEFILEGAPQRQRINSQDMKLDDCVRCKIYKRTKPKAKNQEDEDSVGVDNNGETTDDTTVPAPAIDRSSDDAQLIPSTNQDDDYDLSIHLKSPPHVSLMD